MRQLTNDEMNIVKECIKIIVCKKDPMYPGVRTTFDLAQAQHVEQQIAIHVAKHFGIKERFDHV